MVPGRALMMTNITPPLVCLTVGNGKAEIVGRGPMRAMLKKRTADLAGTSVQEIRGMFLGGVEIEQPSGEQWWFFTSHSSSVLDALRMNGAELKSGRRSVKWSDMRPL
jgi:hypothetical protein